MEADHLIEEDARHCRRRVGVAERNEVGVLREAVDHDEDGCLAVHAGKSFDEVLGDVLPDLRGHRQQASAWSKPTG